MSLRRRYLRALKREFPRFAPIYPQAEILELGEYGIYRRGSFIPHGNIFRDLNLRLEDYIDQTHATVSQIRKSDDAMETLVAGDLNIPDSEISIKIEFDSSRAYILQLLRYTIEGIQLKAEIINELGANIDRLRWRNKFRIVHKRMVCEQLKFAYSKSAKGEVILTGKLPQTLDVGAADLAMSDHRKVESDFWVDSGKITPVVSFVTFNSMESGLDVNTRNRIITRNSITSKKLTFSEPRIFMIDNTDVELEMELEEFVV